jgi:hypothetical protein
MKIPTLIGIALLITLIVSLGLYFYYKKQATVINFQITNLEVVNITNTSATIIWQSSSPSAGQVIYSEFEPLNGQAVDTRDRGQLKERLIHFVTLNNLKPGTKYIYKVKNNSEVMQKSLDFKTANIPDFSEGDLNFSFIKPLKGTVLNANLNPIDESLIFLKIPGAQKLATFSSTAGNFILPLKTVLSQDLSKFFIIAPNTAADLNIVSGKMTSDIKILISENTANLPPIPIGSNLDLSNFKPQPITKIIFNAAPVTGIDFNGDGKVNSLDLAMLRETAKPGGLRGTAQSKFDINGDGTVDQKDVDEFSKMLTEN